MLRCLTYAVVSRFLAVLLLAAVVLKLNGLAADPVGRMGYGVGVAKFSGCDQAARVQ